MWPQGSSISSCPDLVPGATRALAEVVFLGWKLGWNTPAQTSKHLCLITCPPVTLHHPQTHPNTCNTSILRVLSDIGGAVTLKKKAGGGKTTTRRRGHQGTFQSSSSPGGSTILGCTRPALAIRGPAWIWRLWCHPEGTRHSRSKGGLMCWHVLPSSLSPATVQPWDPACSGSRDVTTD